MVRFCRLGNSLIGIRFMMSLFVGLGIVYIFVWLLVILIDFEFGELVYIG